MSLLSPALSSLGGRRGSSSFAIRGQCPDDPIGNWMMELFVSFEL